MITKYGFEFDAEVMKAQKARLIKQIWKLIPLKEEDEAKWALQMESVIEELVGLSKIFSTDLNYLILLSKIEGLRDIEDFMFYRRSVFESISIVGDLYE